MYVWRDVDWPVTVSIVNSTRYPLLSLVGNTSHTLNIEFQEINLLSKKNEEFSVIYFPDMIKPNL